MSLYRKAYIVGVAESDLGSTPDRSPLQLQAQAARAALADAGLGPADVDGLLTTGPWSGEPAAMLAEYLGLAPRFSDTTTLGGASFVAMVGHAAAAIAAGLCRCCLITYGSTQRSDRKRGVPGWYPPSLTDHYGAAAGLPGTVGAYALAAQRYMHQYGATAEDLAGVAVDARQWAALNPKAAKREPITVADVLASPMICDPLHLLDCCVVTDGGGAVVVTGPALARTCRQPAVALLGYGEKHTHKSIVEMPDLTVTGALSAGEDAFRMAAVSHKDLDLVAIYDSFTITVLLSLEALGFCGPGEAGAFIRESGTGPGGRFPMNTNGGGLAYCHPGMYGIFLLIEAVRQLRGEAGERQVNGARLALVNGTGGVLSSTAVSILGRD